ncbi:MAG: hypothetical protein KGZ45_03995 [Clostridium sp.]|nr:hypothetical protein [Clostridium sp.]
MTKEKANSYLYLFDRRLKTLDTHILHAENYFNFRDIHKKYKSLKPKKQGEFYEKHVRQITAYETAKTYLDGVMNGKTSIPTAAWKKERDKLNAERQYLNQEYRHLKDETLEVERIRSRVYDIMQAERRREQPVKSQCRER